MPPCLSRGLVSRLWLSWWMCARWRSSAWLHIWFMIWSQKWYAPENGMVMHWVDSAHMSHEWKRNQTHMRSQTSIRGERTDLVNTTQPFLHYMWRLFFFFIFYGLCHVTVRCDVNKLFSQLKDSMVYARICIIDSFLSTLTTTSNNARTSAMLLFEQHLCVAVIALSRMWRFETSAAVIASYALQSQPDWTTMSDLWSLPMQTIDTTCYEKQNNDNTATKTHQQHHLHSPNLDQNNTILYQTNIHSGIYN